MSHSAGTRFVSPAAFEAIQRVDISRLALLSGSELRPLLPCLVRMALCAPADLSNTWAEDRKRILCILSGIEAVNSIIALLSVDFRTLEQDARKELQLRAKAEGPNGERSLSVSQPQHGSNAERSFQHNLALEFEQSDPLRRLRLTLRELLAVMNIATASKEEFSFMSSDLFQSSVYAEEVADVLCVLQAELPSLLPVVDVALALLHVRSGDWFLCRLVANVPDSFLRVCKALVRGGGERPDEDSAGQRHRADALRCLCLMNPAQALDIRAMATEKCNLPALGITLTLDYAQSTAGGRPGAVSPLVSYVSSLLLGTDAKGRACFNVLVHKGQDAGRRGEVLGQRAKKRGEVLGQMRIQLLLELVELLPGSAHMPSDSGMVSSDSAGRLGDIQAVKASALLRLYVALMGIAGLKPTDEEARKILRLATSRPHRATPAGMRLASVSLCTLLACPVLLGTAEREQLVATWLSQVVKEEQRFVASASFRKHVAISTEGASASFRELLLLVALYFHSNQLAPVVELVCSTLGVKMALKPGALTKMKSIFTQEDMFTEQVITGLAPTLPVTKRLNDDMKGYLPVHCMCQLLRSQAFTAYGVSIKDWLYRQLCETTTPLHPQLLPLIDNYINSILTPPPRATNRPITEQELLDVFQQKGQEAYSLTAQLLLLYYVLLYEENLLTMAPTEKKPRCYSAAFMDQIPIQHLVTQARGLQQELGILYSALLRLLLTNYPHLCVAEAWMLQEEVTGSLPLLRSTMLTDGHTQSRLRQAFRELPSGARRLLGILDQLALRSPSELIPYAEALTDGMSLLLEPTVPRRILHTLRKLWLTLNTVMPSRLWVMTVHVLQPSTSGHQQTYSHKDLVLNPLAALHVDQRVYRCPPLMDIVLHVLNGFLLASRAYLRCHLKEKAQSEWQGQNVVSRQPDISEDASGEEHLRNTLLSVQDSAAVQLLLELCLPTSQEQEQLVAAANSENLQSIPLSGRPNTPGGELTGQRRSEDEVVRVGPTSQRRNEDISGGGEMDTEGGLLSDLREVQCLVFRLLHQMFLDNPNVAKLVHFQGYPPALLPLTTGGIPSIHICLNLIPELLLHPVLEKQVFGIQLLSHLCRRYTLAKSMSMAREAIGVMGTLLARLPRGKRLTFFMPTLPCLVAFCQAFPPLYDDAVTLLGQLAQVCASVVASREDRGMDPWGVGGVDPIVKRLQHLKDPVPREALFPGGAACLNLEIGAQRTTMEPERTDPDIKLCYCVENTFIQLQSLFNTEHLHSAPVSLNTEHLHSAPVSLNTDHLHSAPVSFNTEHFHVSPPLTHT